MTIHTTTTNKTPETGQSGVSGAVNERTMHRLRVIREPDPAWHPPKPIASGPVNVEKIMKAFLPYLHTSPVERAIVVALGMEMQVIGYCEVAVGGLSRAPLAVAEVVKFALLTNACRCVLMHNHPGCDSAIPSDSDNFTTMKIAHALNLVDIDFLDHLIISDKKFFSYRSAGRLKCRQ